MERFLNIQKHLIPHNNQYEMKDFYIATKNIIQEIILNYKLDLAVLRSVRAKQRHQRRKKQPKTTYERYQVFNANKISLKIKQKKKNNKKFGQYLAQNYSGSKKFFSRFSIKQMDQRITDIENSNAPEGATIADKMAMGWENLFQSKFNSNKQGVTYQYQNEEWFPKTIQRLTIQQRYFLENDITEEEVLLALRKLKRKKAPGPDQIETTFYKDFQKGMVPILLATFNAFMHGMPIINEMKSANIFPLKKEGDNPIWNKYRPISLLNSDYKIFSKIMANRLKTILPSIIHDDQNGFVSNRRLENAIHVMQAILSKQYMKTNEKVEDMGVIVLMDLAKAYDSLERSFLYYVLHLFDFPESYIKIIRLIHANTTAKFLVNGFSSYTINITRGIRQGCPLAPYLFIIAMEILLTKIRETPSIEGYTLTCAKRSKVVSIGAFVDDTTLFLKKAANLPRALQIFQKFGELSGLKVQPQKSHGIWLNTACAVKKYCEINFLNHKDTTRFLGVQIGTGPLNGVNWSFFHQNMKIRMGMACQKTTNLMERAQLLQSIYGTTFSFIANYFMPNMKEIKKINEWAKCYLWKGSMLDQSEHQAIFKHKLNPKILAMNCKEGGIAYPNFVLLLQKTAVRKIINWTSDKQTTAFIAGQILLQLTDGEQEKNDSKYSQVTEEVHIGPQILPQQALIPRMQDTIWSFAARCSAYLMGIFLHPFPEAVQMQSEWQLRMQNEQWITNSIKNNWRWEVPFFTSEKWDKYRTQMANLQHQDMEAFLPTFAMINNLFFHWQGKKLNKLEKIKSSTKKHIALKDIFTWTRKGQRSVNFELTETGKMMKLSTEKTKQLIIIGTTTGAIIPFGAKGEEQEVKPFFKYELQNIVWQQDQEFPYGLQGVDQNHILKLKSLSSSFNGAQVFNEVQTGIQHTNFVANHPNLQAMYYHEESCNIKWDCKDEKNRIKSIKKTIIKRLDKKCHLQSTKELKARIGKKEIKYKFLLTLLSDFTWKKLWSTPRITSTGLTTFWFRMKHINFNFWQPTFNENNYQCPMEECKHIRPNFVHVFWQCKRASKCIQQAMSFWYKKAEIRNNTRYERNFFALQPPKLPAKLWENPVFEELWQRNFTQTEQIYCRIWHFFVMLLFRTIWMDRNAVVYRDENIHAEAMFQGFVTQFTTILASTREWTYFSQKKKIEGDIYFLFEQYFRQKEEVISIVTQEKRAQLFFDGGSRGNPGMGGSGAILIENKNNKWNPVKSVSLFLPDRKTTNNYAEYMGLVKGLQLARNHNVTNLTIIGDSKLLTQQFQRKILPKQAKMKKLFRQSQKIISFINNVQMKHEYRSGNKSADWLANEAMDKRKSILRPVIEKSFPTQLIKLLQGDVEYNKKWLVEPTDRPPDN